jgi:hypothetical protein
MSGSFTDPARFTLTASPVQQVFPIGFQWPTVDPFLFCVHHLDHYPKGTPAFEVEKSQLAGRHMGSDFEPKDGFRMYHGTGVPGFPVHPHRGFETITVVRRGYIDHADSLGAAGRYGEGDVQWMTAGSGVQHSEMFPLLHADKANTVELFQIWLNLPRRNKMVKPHFKMFWSEDIPQIRLADDAGTLTLIAGTVGDRKAPAPPPDSWAAQPGSQTQICLLRLEAGKSWTMPADSGKEAVSRVLYFYAGAKLSAAGTAIEKGNGLVLDSTKACMLTAGTEAAEILVLQSAPIKEPVVQQGPFVMNSREEILQTLRDYQATQFGGWSWGRPDMVHGPGTEKFAKYPDGRIERPKKTT